MIRYLPQKPQLGILTVNNSAVAPSRIMDDQGDRLALHDTIDVG
jgi:hypothetical protein